MSAMPTDHTPYVESTLILMMTGISMTSAALAGHRIHLWLIDHAPQARSYLPTDAGVWAGLLFGFAAACDLT